MIFRCRRIPAALKELIICKPNKSCFSGYNFSQSAPTQESYKVTVLGACGGIGQPLCLLLKLNPLITKLACYDIAPFTKGVIEDLSHLNTNTSCEGFKGLEELEQALCDANLVVMAAGIPRLSTRKKQEELFMSNAGIIYHLVNAIVKCCPTAAMAVITEPVNSIVPMISSVMEHNGIMNSRKIIGVTTIDSIRAATFVSEVNGSNPSDQYVPVVGGHDEASIVPLLSQSDPPIETLDKSTEEQLTKKIREAGLQVLNAKKGYGSATLTIAFAAARLVDSILRGFAGESKVLECAYIKSNVTDCPFFSTPVVFGKDGIENVLGYGTVTAYESALIKQAIPIIQKSVKMGEDFATRKMEITT